MMICLKGLDLDIAVSSGDVVFQSYSYTNSAPKLVKKKL